MTEENEGSAKGAGRQLGDFFLTEEIGRGGMGVVFKARQISMGRIVALKVLPSFASLDASSVARFRREAEAAGRLSHPGIVPVYAVGEFEGVHYYAMEFVEGPSLDSLLDSLGYRVPERLLGTLAEESALDQVYPRMHESANQGSAYSAARYARSCAGIAADIASALVVAHAGGIIHRDLKPSNILIHRTGRPVLVDFGLARDELNMGLTQSGDALGTPAYMAPEQACGRTDLDARVDIYGLGATLYELLTLRPPFEGGHAADIMRQIIEVDPAPVRHLNARVPADLERIVHCCLEKDPDQRYPAMEALELDLRAFVEGRPVHARRPSLVERSFRVLTRNRRSAVVGMLVMFCCAVLFSLVGLVGSHLEVEDGRQYLLDAREFLGRVKSQGDARGRVQRAQESYGKAAVLIGQAEVDLIHAQDLRRVLEELYTVAFDSKYPDDALQSHLKICLASWPNDVLREDRRNLAARIEGRGTIEIKGAADARVTLCGPLRAERDGEEQIEDRTEWPEHRRADSLALGSYLVCVERDGLADWVHAVTIERDRVVRIEPRSVPLAEVSEGMRLVALNTAGAAVLMSRTEMDGADYAKILQPLDDEAFRGLRPRTWDTRTAPDSREDSRPVRGLSFRQARAAAAMAGGHLPSEQEFLAAARAGLEDCPYPWGWRFDPDRLVADPRTLNVPGDAAGAVSGRSPNDILNLVGNVSEFLSPGLGDQVFAAGGHFLTDPRAATVGLRTDPLNSGEAKSNTGFRIARFLPPVIDPAQLAKAQQVLDRLRQFDSAYQFADWVITETGEVEYELAIGGSLPTDSTELRKLGFVTPGFVQSESIEVRDGHGKSLDSVTRRIARDASELDVALGHKMLKGQGYRLSLASRLSPLGALSARQDSYFLQVPMKALRHVNLICRVRLPRGSVVESVEPEPLAQYAEDGVPVLLWSFASGRRGDQFQPGFVRFRKDGMLTAKWPVHSRVESFVRSFITALETGEGLADLLSTDFLMEPQGLTRTDVLDLVGSSRAPRFGLSTVHDVTRVGDVTTVWLEVDWGFRNRQGDPEMIKRWPMRFQLRERAGRFEVESIAPATCVDRGQIVKGRYHYGAPLEVTIDPLSIPSIGPLTLRRTGDAMTSMQVTCQRDEMTLFKVLGEYSLDDESLKSIEQRLSGGAGDARLGRPLRRPAPCFVAQVEGRQTEWRFGQSGKFSRESWVVLHLGRRHFLLQSVALGATREEADTRFAAAREFFASMIEAVHIE